MPQKFAKAIMEEFPREKLQLNSVIRFDPESWAQESFKIAETEVYKGIVEHSPVSQEYIDKARKLCKERIALGGYRLAVTIK